MTPYIFLLGWPKCGTSSLFNALSTHPEIQGSTPKETFFLMDRGHPLYARHGPAFDSVGEAGFDTFFDGPPSGRVRLEATTHHVFQDTARHAISRMEVPPHLVFVLREPARRLLSCFRFARDNQAAINPSFTFDRYVAALLDNRMEAIAPHYRSPTNFWVAQRELIWSDYCRWLRNWEGCVPKDNMHLILFEDLAANADHTIRALLSRLGLDPIGLSVDSLARRNESFRIGHHGLHRVARHVSSFLSGWTGKTWLKARYLALQRRSAAAERDYRIGLEALQRHFAPANVALAQDYRMDLSRWHVGG